MAGIPEHIIDQVQDRVDIVEVIGGYIPLKKAGSNYKAPCPFHHEKTPSFMVSQQKQIFRCFGCGAGGNVFHFLMKYERLEFPEAVRMLAQKAGVEIPSQRAESKEAHEASSVINKIYAVNELASGLFHKNLREDKTGRAAYEYLKGRGLSEETINIFRLGFAVSGWDTLLTFARQKDVSADLLEKSGLAIAKAEGGYFDRFRNRIMFTIMDSKSRVLGFGGRVFLKEDTGPKYMNSPETIAYNKGRNLYGLNFTWNHIRDEDEVVIVEGYMDLLVPFQNGIKNIVASLGTSLTDSQVRLLRRYTKNAVIVFDPDAAGEIATLRSLDLLIEEAMNVRVVRLPEGFDPDSFIKKYGTQEFKNRIKEAKNLFEYKISVLVSKYDKKKLEEKAKIVEEMLPTIARIQNAVLKSGYIKRLADELSIEEEAVKQELKKVRLDYRSRVSADAPAKASSLPRKIRESEKILVAILIDDNSYVNAVREKLSAEDFQDPVIRTIVEVLFKYAEASKTLTPGKLINHLEDAQAHRFIPELVDSIEAVMDRQKTVDDCIISIKKDNLKEKQSWLQVQIALAQSKADEDKIRKLILECDNLRKIIMTYEEKTAKA